MGRMATALRNAAHHLVLARQTYFMSLDVPAGLRPVMQKSRLKRSHRTRDLATAIKLCDADLPKRQADIVAAAEHATAACAEERGRPRW